MQTNGNLKKIVSNAAAIVLFLIVSALYCMPALKGEELAPGDTISWLQLSKEAKDYYNATGETPGWINSAFGGMPASAVYERSGSTWMSHVSNMLLMQPEDGLTNPIAFFFWAMVSFFILLKALRINTIVSCIGAVAFAFSSYNPIIIGAGHLTKMLDIAYLPGVVAGIILMYRGKYWQGIIATAVFLSFFYATWHLQIIYYSIFLIAVLIIAFFVQALRQGTLTKFFKSSLILLLVTGCCILANYIAIKGTSRYAQYSIRGGNSALTLGKERHTERTQGGLSKDYAFQWSNAVGETFCLLVPNLYGGQSGQNLGDNSNFGEALSNIGVPPAQVDQMTAQAPAYWGPQPFLSGPVYFGAIVCFLMVLALLLIKNPLKWWLAGAGLFFIMLSWGKNFEGFNYFLFDHLPFYNKFRTPSMALSIASVIFPMLGFWALYEFISKKYSTEVLVSKLKLSLYITGGLVVLIIISSQLFMSFRGAGDARMEQSFGEHTAVLMKALRADRASLALKDGIRSLIFILIAFAALWAFAKEKINKNIALVVVGLACSIDLIGVAHRYLNEDNFVDSYTIEQQFFTPRPVDAEIMKDKDPDFRVLDLSSDTYNSAKSSFFYKTIGGYHPAKLETYQELIEFQLSKLNSAVLNMLNTKYIILPPQQQGAAPQSIPNPNALGNGWFVSHIQFTNSADEMMLALNAPAINDPKGDSATAGFKPDITAIADIKDKASIAAESFIKDSTANIKLTQYSLPRLVYQSVNNHDGFAVFSEVYYPENWKAFVDGKETPIYNVNYVLRGIKVPAGQHTIEFKYIDEEFKKSEKVALVGNMLVVLLIIGAGVSPFVMKKKEKEEEYR